MSATEIYEENLDQLNNEEILELLDNSIEEKGEIPTNHELRKNSDDWPIPFEILEERFGDKQNALWMLGREPSHEILVRENDTELIEHELRGLEHELGRAPTQTEATRINDEFMDYNSCKNAGLPYHAYTRKSQGPITTERENELTTQLIQELLVDGESPERVFRDERASETEIDLFIEEYLPWIDEPYWLHEHNTQDEIEELEEMHSEKVWELLGMVEDGYTQNEIMNELEYSNNSIYQSARDLEEYGLIERKQGIGTSITDQGLEILQNQQTSEY